MTERRARTSSGILATRSTALIICIITLAIAAIYLPFVNSFFCGHDDFMEVYRAKYVNAADPATLITRSHFDGFKYRPLNHALVLFSTLMADGAPWAFRLRNLLFHLLNVMLVYFLSRSLGAGRGAAISAAALFGFHPMTNQTLALAVCTNTTAHAAFLGGLLCLCRMRRDPRVIWPAVAVLLLGAGLFLYEPALMLLPVFGFWIMWWRFKGERLAGGTNNLLLFWGGALLVVGAYFLLHSLYVPEGRSAALAPIAAVIRNSIASVAGLLLPVDPILLHDWLGIALPSRAMLTSAVFWKLAAPLAAAALAAFVLVVYGLFRRGWQKLINCDMVVLLSGAALLSMQPTLWFSTFPSETYLYLPLALLAPAFVELARVAGQTLLGEKGKYLLAGVLVLWLAQAVSALTLRNYRVKNCGECAYTILSSLPSSLSQAEAAVIGLIPEAGSLSGRHYGPYGHLGLDVIGYNWPDEKAVQEAVRLFFKNTNLRVELGRNGVLPSVCHQGAWCAWVGRDGAVRPVVISGSTQLFSGNR